MEIDYAYHYFVTRERDGRVAASESGGRGVWDRGLAILVGGVGTAGTPGWLFRTPGCFGNADIREDMTVDYFGWVSDGAESVDSASESVTDFR
jgi:hypothetical protein